MTGLVEKDAWRPRSAVWAGWAGIAVAVGVFVWILTYVDAMGSWALIGWIVTLPVWVFSIVGGIMLGMFLGRGGQGTFTGGWAFIVLGALVALVIFGGFR